MEKEFCVKIYCDIIDFSKTSILSEINELLTQAIIEYKNRKIESPKNESDSTFKSISELVISNMHKMDVYEDEMHFYENDNLPSEDEIIITPDIEILNNLITQSFHQISFYIFENHSHFKSINDYYDTTNQRVTSLDEVKNEMLFIKNNLIDSLYLVNSILVTKFIRKNYLAPLITSYLFLRGEKNKNITKEKIFHNYTIANKAQTLKDLSHTQILSLLGQADEIWRQENSLKKISINSIAKMFTDIWGIKVSRSALSKYLKKHNIGQRDGLPF